MPAKRKRSKKKLIEEEVETVEETVEKAMEGERTVGIPKEGMDSVHV